MTKVCLICQQEFPLTKEFFYFHKQHASSYCKTCHDIKNDSWRSENIEKVKTYGRKSLEKTRTIRRKKIKEKLDALLLNDFKKCSSCKQTLSKNQFNRSKHNFDGFKSQCVKCRSEKSKQGHLIRREKRWAALLISSAKKHSKIVNREVTITEEWVLELFNSQQGKCYWTGVPLLITKTPKHPQKPSLDRIDSEKGYTPDNVILTSFSMNFARNSNSFEDFKQFIDILKETIRKE
jgi:hypothetical protein